MVCITTWKLEAIESKCRDLYSFVYFIRIARNYRAELRIYIDDCERRHHKNISKQYTVKV
jgi:hypothetical protein